MQDERIGDCPAASVSYTSNTCRIMNHRSGEYRLMILAVGGVETERGKELTTNHAPIDRPALREPECGIRSSPMHPSAQIYSQFALRLYDFFVLWFSNSFAWLCPHE